jgi:hypothetical protein
MNSPFVLEIQQYEGDGLTFIDPVLHDTKKVKLDGKEYPVEREGNQHSSRSASVRRVGEHTLEMTEQDSGHVILTREIKLSSDGKRLTMTINATGASRPTMMVFDRE